MYLERIRKRLASWCTPASLVLASAYFAHQYASVVPPFLNIADYENGRERVAFQARVLMRYPLIFAERSSVLHHLTKNQIAINTPELLLMEMVSFVCLLLSGWAAIKLYRFILPAGPLPYLPSAILIILCFFNYIVGMPFSFPYDLPSTMFLGWGTYFVFTRKFAWLLPVFVVGTFNRETTAFLILIGLLVALTEAGRLKISALTRRDVLQLGTLSVIWLAITEFLHHHYAGNPAGDRLRITANLHTLAHPLGWPLIFSASAFLLPYVFLNRTDIGYAPLRSALLVLPIWVVFLLTFGNITEIRIYGDISVFVAVAVAAILVKKMSVQSGLAE